MIKNQRGFSLVELLVVTVIMGLVVASIYTLYISTQRSAITSEEVVEVQQNLRFALDQLAGDLRMGGFLVPTDGAPLESAPTSLLGGTLTLNSSMPNRRYARIVSAEYDSSQVKFIVELEEMVDLFNADDHVFVIRPPTKSVIGSCTAGCSLSKNRSARWIMVDGLSPGLVFSPGDILAPAFNQQISYTLEPHGGTNVNMLRRTVAGDTADVAEKISDVAFSYILSNGTETPTVTNLNINNVVAVRIRMVGQTDNTMTGQDSFSGLKTREIETVVRLRNR